MTYLLLDQNRPHAELFQRNSTSSWTLTEHNGIEEAVELTDLDIRLDIAQIYRDTLFAREAE